jgi:serine/threonine-protein kinase
VTTSAELLPGTLVDRRYRIQRVLGRGGFGRTYLAVDKWRFGELCVLKEFAPSNRGDAVVTQKLRELFQREATILHKLNHPQIPKFFAVFEESGRLFIVQEYINGKTYWNLLRDKHQNGDRFTETEILQWLKDLLRVLGYLHKQNIVHRDISPDNVMLARGRKLPILIDFGAVKQAATQFNWPNQPDAIELIQASVSVGKSGYAPYEQLRMGQCSPRSDLYALAVTAMVLLTAKPPSQLMDSATLEWKWQSLVSLSPRLVKILERMMAEKPQDRYSSAEEVLRDLQLLNPTPVNARTPLRELFGVPQGPPPVPPHVAPQQAPQRTVAPAAQPGQAEPKPGHQTTLPPVPLLHTAKAQNDLAEPAPSPSPLSLKGHLLPPSVQRIGRWVSGQWVATVNARGLSLLTQRSPHPSSTTALDDKPQSWLGKPSDRTPLTINKMLLWGSLTLLPIASLFVGIKSSEITAVCTVLDNCAEDQRAETRLQRATDEASAASTFARLAKNLPDLKRSRERLSEAVSNLSALANHPQLDAQQLAHVQHALVQYQATLLELDERLALEAKSIELLRRAQAEALDAEQRTQRAKTPEDFAIAQASWQKALASLQEIQTNTLASGTAIARTQQYNTRLTTVAMQAPGGNAFANAAPANAAATPPMVVIAVNPNSGDAIAMGGPAQPIAQPIAQPTVPSTGQSVAIAPAPATPRTAQTASRTPRPSAAANPRTSPTRPAPASAGTANATRRTPILTTPPAAIATQPSPPSVRRTAPSGSSGSVAATPRQRQPLLKENPSPDSAGTIAQTPPSAAQPVARRSSSSPDLIASTPPQSSQPTPSGATPLSVEQTLDNVSIQLNGVRVSSNGTFTASVVVQNRSDRKFGFVPLFARVTDAEGNEVRSRLSFVGVEDAIAEPGEVLRGEVYFLNRQWNRSGNQNLALVIQEGTTGSRNFNIPF